MTPAEYILSDIVLLKIPINTECNIMGIQSNALINHPNTFSPETLAEMNKIITNQNETIKAFLLGQKYIKSITPGIKQILTKKGEIAQQKNGHIQYLEYEKKQKRKDFITNIPKTYWYLIGPFAFFIGLFIDFFKNDIKDTTLQKLQQDTTQLYKTIEILRDSVQYMAHQQKETLYIQKNLLSQSKIDSTK